MGRHVAGQPQRYRHGWIPVAPAAGGLPAVGEPYLGGEAYGTYHEIHKSDLSSGDARRSREVSPEEFQKIAARGAAQYQKFKRASSSPEGLRKNWGSIVNSTFNEVQKDWGGATIDAHSGKALEGNEDKYALTVRDPGMQTVSVHENPTIDEWRAAMNTARDRYQHILARQDHYLGVFHDNDKHTVDIDPVFVTGNKEHTETIGAYTHAVGGAYHFKSGDGFWPPHVKDGK